MNNEQITNNQKIPWDSDITKKWLPVDMYIGGAEHTVLHLLYSRFVTMAFHDWGLLEFEEPYKRFYAHGLIIKDGAKMSKSKGNVVIPDEYIRKYGSDTLRSYLMFLGPFDMGGDFRDTGIAGMYKFLGRVWRLVSGIEHLVSGKVQNTSLERAMHKTIKEVTADMTNLRYNTAIAHIMEYVKALTMNNEHITINHIQTLLLLLAPFAPHMTEELYQQLFIGNAKGEFSSIHKQKWPLYEEKFLVEYTLTIVVQINGKVRDVLTVQSQKSKVKSQIENLALESDKVKKFLEGKSIIKTIFVPGKLINFVV